MRRSSSWRSLRWVMLLTIHVAVVSLAVRSIAGPVSTGGTSLRWAALTVMVAGSLLLPFGEGIAAMMYPGPIADDRSCPRCSRPELRPLRSRGRGLFDDVRRFRCGACWTLYDVEGESLVESSRPETPDPIGSPGIWYLGMAEDRTTGEGIEFVGDVEPAPRTSPAGPCPEVMRSGSSDESGREATRR